MSELLEKSAAQNDLVFESVMRGIEKLATEDARLYELLQREQYRQNNVLTMVAASSGAEPSVLVCQGMATTNVTTEGYPGARFHGGCEIVDEIERMAIERAKSAFNAQYANVQPHSGTAANGVVIFSLLRPGDTLLGLDLNSGGHLTHGSTASIIGQYFNSIGYGLTKDGYIDYDQVQSLAKKHRPKLIICGASAYPRLIDFKRFRAIADEVGSYLLADISHVAGLVVAGEHPSPIDHAHFATTSTYKQLYGPRGGLILIGKDANAVGPDGTRSLADLMQRGVFPFFQGTPDLSAIAAKARALAMVGTPQFKKLAKQIVVNARELSQWFVENDYKVLTGGTDNHTVLIDVFVRGITGIVAEKALEECDIVINKNRIAGDSQPAQITSGIRLGTNTLALRGMGPPEMRRCAALIHRVLDSIEMLGPKKYNLDPNVRDEIKEQVCELCVAFPNPLTDSVSCGVAKPDP